MEPTADHDDNIAQSPSTRANAAADDGGPLHPWMPVTFASRSPGSRVFPSAVVHGDSLYIFGGHDGGVYRNDLLVFNLETRVWLLDLELTGGGPSPRDAHAAVVHDEWMYVFGGYDSKRYLNDFHRFHFDDLAWSSVPVGGGAPSPRGGHTAVVHAGEMWCKSFDESFAQTHEDWREKYGALRGPTKCPHGAGFMIHEGEQSGRARQRGRR